MVDNQRPSLLVLLNTFPWGAGEEFFAYELPFLAEEFELTLSPTRKRDERRPVPEAVSVVARTSTGRIPLPSLLRAFVDLGTELRGLARPTARWSVTGRRLRRLFKHARGALRAAGGLTSLEHEIGPLESKIPLSYWGNLSAVALAWSGQPFAVRLGGYDLYWERNQDGYRPFQGSLLRRAAVVLVPSEHARDYLAERYPDVSERLVVSRRGVPRQESLNPASEDGSLKLLSISTVSAVKRPELIAEAVQRAVDAGLRVHWTHIGDGPGYAALRQRVDDLGIGRQSNLVGRVAAGEAGLFPLLRSRPFDLMINVSTSEGLPSSLQEALSFGIPVMATSVGGNTEIVRESGGILLPADPVPADILEGLWSVANRSSAERARARERAVRAQHEHFDVAANMAARCRTLRSITPSSH